MLNNMTPEEVEEYINSWREKFLAKFVDLPEADFSSGPQTTVIRGTDYWATCYRHACYFAKYIYKLTGSKQADNPDFYTEYPEKMDELEEYWEEWDFLKHNSGLMGALFKQKGYDPNSKTDLCPPILVFRGTDFDDMSGLGAFASIEVSKGVWWTFRFPWTGENGVYVGDWRREDFIKAGYDEHQLYKEEGVVNGLLARPFDFDWNININTKIELYIYTKGGFGDWGNNLTQGMGKESEQYKEAIQFGRDIVEEKIATTEDKRLMVTGHSLGGGLAAATCCVLEASYPDITFNSIIFNAAGVHRNTIARELKSDETRAMSAMSSNPCFDICVEDEILTTLGAHHKKLPILGSIFTYVARHIGQHGLPNPSDIATLRDIPGYSPGSTAKKAKHKENLNALPERIKPILEADSAKADAELKQRTDLMTPLHGYAGADFLDNIQKLYERGMRNRQLARMIEENNYEEAIKKIDEILAAEAYREDASFEKELKHARSVLAAEIHPIVLPPKGVALRRLFPIGYQNATAMPRLNGFPLVNMLDNFFHNSHNMSDVVTQFLRFLNERYGERARDASWTFVGSYEKMIERFISALQPEIDVIMLLMGLSAEYHGMDIVIASYEAMLAERGLTDEQKAQKEQERLRQHEAWRDEEAEKERQRIEELVRRMQYENYQNYQPSNIGWESLMNLRF